MTCGATPATIDALDCQEALSRLRKAPACARLFEEDVPAARDCAIIEEPLELAGRVSRLAQAALAFEPAEIRDQQRARARRLLDCVCRNQSGAASGGRACAQAASADPFTGEAFGTMLDERLAVDEPAESKELVCLAWAASAVQGHKAQGMTFPEALRCAFDDPTIAAAKELVVSLEASSCQ
jgi:hypothetical protein